MNCLKCQAPFESDAPLHGLHPRCFVEEFGLERTTEFQDLFERSNPSGGPKRADPAFRKFNSSFFHGRYRKYSGTLDGKSYIIKMQQDEFPELPSVEYACNRVARALGILLPDFHFIRFENRALSFLSRNLMDSYAPATLDHIYKFVPSGASFSCETLVEIILKETGRLSEVHRFVELCLFDAVIGNNDRHGRNLALISKSGGSRILSPFYDNPSYVGVAEAFMLGSDLQPRGTIATAGNDQPRLRDYLADFRRLKLDAPIDKFTRKLLSRSSALIELVRRSPALSDARARALIQLMEKRMQELENA